jgi:hypothetical protein
MQIKTRDALRKAFFEAFFVVFGVILALGANEWRQSAAAQRHADRAAANIEAELRANRALVLASMEYHNGLVAMLGERGKTGEPIYPREFSRGFIFPALVEGTGWEVAKETGAVADMDYDRVLEYSSLYGSQQRYRTQAELVGGMIYQKMFDGGINSITDNHKNLLSIIYTFIYRENGLLREYDAVLGAADQEIEEETDDGSTE